MCTSQVLYDNYLLAVTKMPFPDSMGRVTLSENDVLFQNFIQEYVKKIMAVYLQTS